MNEQILIFIINDKRFMIKLKISFEYFCILFSSPHLNIFVVRTTSSGFCKGSKVRNNVVRKVLFQYEILSAYLMTISYLNMSLEGFQFALVLTFGLFIKNFKNYLMKLLLKHQLCKGKTFKQ